MSSSSQRGGALIKRDPWYYNPTFLWLVKSTAINFILPFFNGVMLGFGEILSNEVLFKYGWFGFTRPNAVGIHGIPSSATSEYKKAVSNEIKREQRLQQEPLLLD
ncbi:hypothetical protein INT47_005825 [Mucor saturninus]|uniref:Uncharacterized protein n=1 Tax=Mucor saturninus TaxID=64648 RepID=A0A8H7QXL5_9FUNG|nr:hypothetical protein INT47_005825 [Mucor saturninus]